MKRILYMALAVAIVASSADYANAQGLRGKLNSKLAGKNSKAEDTTKKAEAGKSDGNKAAPHTGNFVDDFGISGSYHLWHPWVFIHRKPSARSGKELEADAINVDYNPDKMSALLYLVDGQYDNLELKAFTGDTYEKTVWNSSKVYTSSLRTGTEVSPSNTEDKRSSSIQFLQVEDGLMVIGKFYYNTKAPWVTLKDEDASILNVMAKDPSKLEGLTLDKVKAMAQKRAEEINAVYRDARAGNIKLPSKGMATPSMAAEAHKLMHTAAASDDAGDWSGTHLYTYIHSKDWGVTYKDIQNTQPVKRRLAIIGVATSTAQPGKCFYQVGYLQQDWNGSEYGPTFFSGFGGGKIHTTCENANAHK
jgi:hypothetical protein